MSATILLAAAILAQAEPPAVQAPVADAPAAAVVEAAAGVIPYPAAFFAEGRPTSAFDMIGRLPGFTFNRGETVRGFAGSAGNVLIDGERPTSKSVTLEELLRRLPASSVVRIDLIRGGAPGIDMQGQPLVANVIRSRVTSQDLAVTAGLRVYSDDGWLGPQTDLEWARRAGGLSLEGGVHYGWTESPDSGSGARIRYAPGGALRESGPFYTRERVGLFTANGSAELDHEINVYRLNGGVSRSDSRDYERVTRVTAAGVSRGDQVTYEPRIEKKLEIGGDYTHVFREGLSAQVLALQTLTRVASNETSTQPGTIETSANHEKSGESILRATGTWQPSEALTLEGGGEGAFNVLDGRTAVTENGQAVILPNATLRVEERRAEGFVTASWKPSAQLSVVAGLRAEASRISSSGDTARSRSFFFPKPRLVVAYSPDAASQLRVRLERTVGQLRFRDFVASADLASGTLSAGNANLEPERAWVIEAAAERRFWGKGAIVATFTHEEVQQVVDLIPIAGRDAPGNIGDGTRDKANVSLTLPLDRLGLTNGLITGQATWRWSSVIDPVTGQERRISREQPFSGTVNFSQDIAALSSTWGVEGRFSNSGTSYRINEIRRESEDSLWSVYWDWKPDRTLSVRAEFRNLASRERRRWRERFGGPRNVSAINEVEWQDNHFQPFVYFRVRKAL